MGSVAAFVLFSLISLGGAVRHAPEETGIDSSDTQTLLTPTDGGAPLPALHKRGMGWGLSSAQLHQFAGLAWWYNWGPNVNNPAASQAAEEVGMRFIPMQWGRWGIEQLAASLEPGSTVLLGFNEPNHGGQARIDPATAAALWRQLQPIADRLGLRLGSPAAAPCGAQCLEPSPFVWWDQFFAHCQGCRVDFLATHYYGGNMQWLAAYLQECRKYGRPIWLTEFAIPNPGGPDVVSWDYMTHSLELLDRDPWVEKYAWFAPLTDGWLGTADSLVDRATGELTTLGRIYLHYTPVPQAAPDMAAAAGGAAGNATATGAAAGGGQAGGESWSQLCAPCIRHLSGGGRLGALPPRQRSYCGLSCGFWEGGERRGGPAEN